MPIYQIVVAPKAESQVICLAKNSENRIAASIIVYNLHISLSELAMWNVMVCCRHDTEVK
jgi:hypothetical protein